MKGTGCIIDEKDECYVFDFGDNIPIGLTLSEKMKEFFSKLEVGSSYKVEYNEDLQIESIMKLGEKSKEEKEKVAPKEKEEKQPKRFQLTSKQEELCNKRLDKDVIKTIKNAKGVIIKYYVDGKHIKSKLNEVFGIGNWKYEFKLSPIKVTKQSGVIEKVGYQSDVTLKLWDKYGNTFEQSEIGTCGLKYTGLNDEDQARKGAITDGLKRCAYNLGPAFGLHIMDDVESDKEEVEKVEK